MQKAINSPVLCVLPAPLPKSLTRKEIETTQVSKPTTTQNNSSILLKQDSSLSRGWTAHNNNAFECFEALKNNLAVFQWPHSFCSVILRVWNRWDVSQDGSCFHWVGRCNQRINKGRCNDDTIEDGGNPNHGNCWDNLT